MHAYRSHTCGQLRQGDAGQTVRLSGWVHRKRDHGNLLFVDLRDHYGITQCVADSGAPMFAALEALRLESVITVTGKVEPRSADTINAKLPTGQIEIRVDTVEVQSAADPLPFQVAGEQEPPEDMRLRYRMLDLRRERVHANMILRSQVIASIRKRMIEAGFFEFQTPILTASSPEGARDYLVPSRIHPGKFYALPQAPQQFKQLLMVSGFDRYFQIAPCFRDEDGRADRSPGEFYQLDLEMSFVTQDDVFDAVAPVLAGVFEEFGKGRKVTKSPFPRIAYDEAIRTYGSDKPDLRNPVKLQNVSAHFKEGGFSLFARMLQKDENEVWAVPGVGGGSRAFCDRMDSWAKGEGQPGLGYIFWRNKEAGGLEGAGPLATALGPDRTEAIRTQLGLGVGDVAFFIAGNPKKFYKFAGLARTKVCDELSLMGDAKDEFRFCWIVDFPMYERNEDTNQIEFSHNPFSMPQGGMDALLNQDPLTIKAYQYDIVCNGVELSSGAIRNHKPEIMIKAFEIAGYPASEVEARFGGMLAAFRLGAPPHGGSAPGIDRIVMLLAEEKNIREVILFPMNQQAEDLMMQAPAEITPARLRELHIRLDLPKPKGSESKGETGKG